MAGAQLRRYASDDLEGGSIRLSWGLQEYARCQSGAGVPPVVVRQLADATDVSSHSDSDRTAHLRSKQAVIVCQKQRRCNWRCVSLRDLVRFSGELTAFHGDRRWIPPYALIRHEQHKTRCACPLWAR
jgi:hypothetical protein